MIFKPVLQYLGVVSAVVVVFVSSALKLGLARAGASVVSGQFEVVSAIFAFLWLLTSLSLIQALWWIKYLQWGKLRHPVQVPFIEPHST